MKVPAVLKSEAGQWAVLGLVVVGVVYFLGRRLTQAAGAAAGAAGGVLSGNNALTAGTPYAGDGVVGTLGAAANTVSGGTLEHIGDYIGGKLADWFQSPTASTPAEVTGAGSQAITRDQVGASNFNQVPDIYNTGIF